MERAYGLYTHIRANRRRSMALFIGLFLLVYLMVFAGALLGEGLAANAGLGELLIRAERDLLSALPWATLGTALWIAIAYKFHQSLIDAVTGGREVARSDEPRVWNLLENLCISRGISMPKLKLIESNACNAFATGLNQKQYAISLTRGLLENLDDAEIEAVLGHELTHIRNGDVRLLVIALVIAGAISFFAELIVRIFFQSSLSLADRRRSSPERRDSGGAPWAVLIAVALIAVAWVLAIMIRFALSRSREYLADAGSVELTKNPDAMILALRKIEGRGDLERANSAVMEMCIDNPREDMADLFDTHPPIQKRVDALIKFAGGHDPGPIGLSAPGESSAAADTAALPERPPFNPAGAPTSGSQLPGRATPMNQSAPSSGPWGPHQSN